MMTSNEKMKQTLNEINGRENVVLHISGRQTVDNMFGSGRSFVLMKYFDTKRNMHASVYAGYMLKEDAIFQDIFGNKT